MEEVQYLDWNNSIQTLNKAYETGLFVLIIGPKGKGKTSLVRDFEKSKGVNLSLKNEFNPMMSKHLLSVFPLSVCRSK